VGTWESNQERKVTFRGGGGNATKKKNGKPVTGVPQIRLGAAYKRDAKYKKVRTLDKVSSEQLKEERKMQTRRGVRKKKRRKKQTLKQK